MAVTADELVDIAKKHGIDNWRTYDRMRTITNSEPAGTLPRLLWEAFRDKKLDLGALQNGWWDLGEVPDAYTGADFIRLLEAIAKHYASQPSYSQPWGRDNVPGWPNNMDHVFDAKSGDPDFYKSMADKWQSLPDPYDRALGFHLATKGVVDAADLPSDLLEECATHYVEHVEYISSMWENTPWPEQVWNKALLNAALTPSTSVVKAFTPFRGALDEATPQEYAKALQKLGGTTDRDLPPRQKSPRVPRMMTRSSRRSRTLSLHSTRRTRAPHNGARPRRSSTPPSATSPRARRAEQNQPRLATRTSPRLSAFIN